MINNPYATPTARLDILTEHPSYQPRVFALSGRIGRLRYFCHSWNVSLLAFIVLGACSALIALMIATTDQQAYEFGEKSGPWILVAGLAACIPPTRRRLQDLNYSSWLVLLLFVPLLGQLFWLMLCLMPGNPSTNKYGPPAIANTAGTIASASIVPVVTALMLALAFREFL